MIEDVRYALRQFLKTPGFTLTAVLTLALGIGATTAIFTLIHAVILQSLPVARPSELIRIGDHENCCVNGGLQQNWSLFSYSQYTYFRENTPGFSSLAAFQAGANQIGVRRQGSSEPARPFVSEFVSANAFETLGLKPFAGRLLEPSDDRRGAPPVAVMSYIAWHEKFGHDPSLIGATLIINSVPVTVAGVAPPGFFGERLSSDPASFWLPLSAEPAINGANSILDRPQLDWLNIIGRLAPGAQTKPIEARLQVELRQWLASPVSELKPAARALIPKQTLRLAPGGAGVQRMKDDAEDSLRLLMFASAFVLLIACANLANLMLVRSTARQTQSSLRAALGASRWRLVRQALTESVVLALLGAFAGLFVAYAGASLILRLAFEAEYVPIDPSPSGAVLLFTFALAVLTGVVFGVAPAWMTANSNPVEALRGAGRSTRRGSFWAQKALVILQAAVSLVLLCAAGLLTQALDNLRRQPFGFETAHRYVLHIDPQMAGYQPSQCDAFFRQLHESLARIPGVTAVGYGLYTPLEGDNWGEGVYFPNQPPPPPDSNRNGSSWVRVSPDYFSTIGTRILAGRAFTPQDTRGTPEVAVVNKTFAKKFFPNVNPIGQHFGHIDPKYAGEFEIVGVTEDTEYWSPGEAIRPMYFLPATQWGHYADDNANKFEEMSHLQMRAVVIQAAADLPGLESQVRLALAQINPNLTVIDFRTFAGQVHISFLQQVMIARLTSLFGLVALVLASIGLYGVTAFSVARRTSEIGVRMALGAGRASVLRDTLRGALTQVSTGLAVGLPLTFAAGRLINNQLYGIKPDYPPVLATTVATLAAAALIAAFLPARRAASIDPAIALRVE